MAGHQRTFGFATGRVWTPQQDAVFHEIVNGNGHVLVRARAGSGKTSTIVEALIRLSTQHRVLLCAFNRSIVKELKSRFGAKPSKWRNISTLHSHGLGLVRARWGGPKTLRISHARAKLLAAKTLDLRDRTKAPLVAAAVAMCKYHLLETAREVADSDVDLSFGRSRPDAADIVARVLERSRQFDGTIDCDDMIYLPAAGRWSPPKRYDFVFVDEAQDMSRAQLELALLALDPRSGRLVLVGDDRQAIYKWRGAEPDGMDRMGNQLSAAVRPLSVTFRCARRIADVARVVVPDLRAVASAPPGLVSHADVSDMGWRPGDTVLSRTNAPLYSLALATMRAQVRVRVKGLEIGSRLIEWIRELGETDVRHLVAAAARDTRAEVALRVVAKDHAGADRLRDRFATLDALARDASDADAVIALITRLSEESEPHVLFSTTHKAKGEEWDRVWLLTWTFRPDRDIEEENIWYVAVTRAKHTLVLVTDRSNPNYDETVNAALRSAR